MRQTVRSLRARVGGIGNRVRNVIRRMGVSTTDGALWVLEGVEDYEGNVETDEAEVFSGVGFYSRPARGRDVEAVVARVGGESGHGVVVATRDHALVQLLDLGDNETAIATTKAVVKITADGTIEVGSHDGAFAPLATKADIDALRLWALAHVHSGVTTGGGSSGAPAAPPPSAIGTRKLRAE